METVKNLTLLCLVLFVGLAAAQVEDQVDGSSQNVTEYKSKKALSVFNIVRFPNKPCGGSGSQNGTCYTSSECTTRNGVAAGSCADGYGVCCVFTVRCGGKSAENCTYFESASTAQPAGQCTARICKANSDICQLRIDFSSFVITGPSTLTLTTVKAISGGTVSSAAGVFISYATNCLTDKFSVTSSGGGSPPVICGKNNNVHMYVDASDNCNEFNFQLGPTGIGATIPERKWSMKVTQISCQSAFAAPPGCTQYFYGPSSGKIETFNHQAATPIQLANQQQNICFRREKGFCSLCLSPPTDNDFSVSGKLLTVVNAETKCCNYGTDGKNTKGYDCLIVPGAQKAIGAKALIPNSFCGGLLGTIAGSATRTTVCTSQTPFMVSFLSDGFSWQMDDVAVKMAGFNLDYFQTAC